MKGSENLWSEDELLTQMEQMQDQIDQLGREKDVLARTLTEKETILEEMERTSSSEILKLQSTLQQAQKKLQEQSDRIVMLSSADLILQDNERLKEDNARLQKERERSEREADRAKEAFKARLQKKDEDLQQKIQAAEKKEAQARNREQQANDLARNREHLISEKVSAEADRISKQLAGQYSRLIDLLREDFFKKEKVAVRRQTLTSVYALMLTVLLACRCGLYMETLTNTTIQIGNGIMFSWNTLCRFAGNAAGISEKIPMPFLSGMIHWAIFVIVIIFICLIILGLFFMVTRWIWRRFHHQLKLWQVMLWASGIIMVSAYFGDQIYSFLPVNIVYCDLCLCAAACLFNFAFGKKRYKWKFRQNSTSVPEGRHAVPLQTA